MLEQPWRIELFGGLRASRTDRQVVRFQSSKYGALLAYLAYYRQQTFARDALVELLWPGEGTEAGRNRLRVTLSSLRRQLEPPGVPAGAVLVADRLTVRLNPEAVTTDVMDFHQALQYVVAADNPETRIARLTEAVQFYGGELLPGQEEAWVLPERSRLQEAYLDALRQLIALLSKTGNLDRALHYARQAIASDPLREEMHYTLMQLYAAVGQPSAALLQFQELERLLKAELDAAPSAPARRLAEQIRTALGHRAVAGRPTDTGASPAPTPAAALAETPATQPVGRVPLQFTRFFGREQEVVRLQEQVRPDSTGAIAGNPDALRPPGLLITLLGPGGTGKTRLAIEVAARQRDRFPGGVWFVPLADLSNPDHLPTLLADTLLLPRAPEGERLEQVLAALGRQPALLILDNCEQLVETCGPVFQALRERAPSLSLLATSRRSLGLPGEREFPVRPLPLPTTEGDAATLIRSACIQLFVDRAQAIRPDFQLTDRNAPAVAALCRQLEGIPLAIELAAARIRVLTPAQMRERLAERFDLLTNPRADKDARHRSLRAAVEWSYRLLPVALQRLFARLSVFCDGFTLEACEAVCQDPATLESLEQLRANSLLMTEEQDETLRFRMLETLREFAAEQLRTRERNEGAHRHANYYLTMQERASAEITGPAQGRWLKCLDAEYENMYAALRWAEREGETELALKLATGMWALWYLRGHIRAGREHLTQALARTASAGPTAERAQAFNLMGVLAIHESDYAEGRRFLEQSLAIRRERKDAPATIAAILNNLGIVSRAQGDYPASNAFLEESLHLWRGVGNAWGIAGSLSNLGESAMAEGDYFTSRTRYLEALAMFRNDGNTIATALCLNNLGGVAFRLGDYSSAQTLCTESLTLFRQMEDRPGCAHPLGWLGVNAIHQGDFAAARAHLAESLQLRQESGDKAGIAGVLESFALLAYRESDALCAARLRGAAESLRRRLGAPDWPSSQRQHEQSVASLRATLGEQTFERAWRLGAAWSIDQAIACALNTDPS